jgi:hypothetical protein
MWSVINPKQADKFYNCFLTTPVLGSLTKSKYRPQYLSKEEDFVVRTEHSPRLGEKIESKAANSQELSEIKDIFYKPEDLELADFNPREVILRKRKFPDRETKVKINIVKKPLGYTDTKEKIQSLED